MRWLIVMALLGTLARSASADETTTKIGEFRPSQGGGSMQLSVVRGGVLEGAGLACYDEHVIESVHFYRMRRADLERLRALIDATITALGK